MDCSTLSLIHTLYCWVLSKGASSTIFLVFSMTRPGIKPRSSSPLSNTLLIRPINKYRVQIKMRVFQLLSLSKHKWLMTAFVFCSESSTNRRHVLRCYIWSFWSRNSLRWPIPRLKADVTRLPLQNVSLQMESPNQKLSGFEREECYLVRLPINCRSNQEGYFGTWGKWLWDRFWRVSSTRPVDVNDLRYSEYWILIEKKKMEKHSFSKMLMLENFPGVWFYLGVDFTLVF